MLVSRSVRWDARAARGFSLLEVLVASALLLATVTAVSLCVTSVSRGGARLEAAMEADRALRMVAGHLGALPYCAPSYPDAREAAGMDATDLVAAVFPHALGAASTPEARYCEVRRGRAFRPARS